MKRTRILTSLAEFLDASRAEDLRLVIAFVDVGGNLQMLWREPGAWLGSNDMAVNKAWTAVAFSGPHESEGRQTKQLDERSQPEGELFGVQNSNRGRAVFSPGGIPVYENGKLIGGIGVSGSSAENDQRFAEIALKAYERLVEQENAYMSTATDIQAKLKTIEIPEAPPKP